MQTTQISARNCNSLLKGAKQKQTNTHTHTYKQKQTNTQTNKQQKQTQFIIYFLHLKLQLAKNRLAFEMKMHLLCRLMIFVNIFVAFKSQNSM